MTRVETVVSELFPALPVLPPDVGGPLLRALKVVSRTPDPEFVDSIDRELTESYEAWCLRYFGELS